MSGEELLQSFQFLNSCGLVTVTHVTDDFESSPYYCKQLLSDFGEKPSKQEIVRTLNICMKYPMFYVDIVQDLLGEDMPDVLPSSLLGSIVECHARGLLPDTGCFEYHDAMDREIDYVSTSLQKAVEISVSNKKLSQTHFDALPENYGRILLTKDRWEERDGVAFIPHYQFIFENSAGREFFKKTES